MKSLLESLIVNQFNAKVTENLCQIISEENINESFQSSLLIELAKKISEIEKESNERKIDQAKHQDETYETKYGKHDPQVVNFKSIFGPITQTNYGKSNKLQGLKWSEIKDSDFVKYTDTKDKAFLKFTKDVYNHKESALFICCEPGTKNIVYFIKAYGKELKSDIIFYQFTPTESWMTRKGLYEKTAKKGKFGSRPMKMVEMLPLIEGLDIYVLHVTDSLKTEYKLLTNDRKEAQKGVINYDKKSLEKLLYNQQARYKELVKQMKAMNLKGNIEKYFDEIVQTNNEIIDLYKKITSNPKYMDLDFELGNLMNNMAYVYQEYYSSIRYTHLADKEAKADPQYRGTYYREESDEKINRSKSYLKDIQEKIDYIKSKL